MLHPRYRLANSRRKVEAAHRLAIENNRAAYADNEEALHHLATSEYIYNNQKEDALFICNDLISNPERVAVMVNKQPKVGANGLMYQILYNATTHSDDEKCYHLDDCFVMTGMSNLNWENDFKAMAPVIFESNIFHHGKLKKMKEQIERKIMANKLLIVDEIDTGDKPEQVLNKILRDLKIDDIEYLQRNNIKLVLISATPQNPMLDIIQGWPEDTYVIHNMKIPESYVSCEYLRDRGYLQNYYGIKCVDEAKRWIYEDIINHFGNDYRIHFIRLREKTKGIIQQAIKDENLDIEFKICSHEKTTMAFDQLGQYFKNPINRHIIIGVKDYYRRANLIPNDWKIKIGCMHDMFANRTLVATSVQSFPGRMCGYWKDFLEKNPDHKLIIRTNLSNINKYIDSVKNKKPFKDGKRTMYGNFKGAAKPSPKHNVGTAISKKICDGTNKLARDKIYLATAKKLIYNKNSKRNPIPLVEINGYWISTRIGIKKENIKLEHIMTNAEFENTYKNNGICLSKTNNMLILPVYPTKYSGPDEVEWWVTTRDDLLGKNNKSTKSLKAFFEQE